MYNAGLIGNCAYLAHINKNTNVTWLCWPRFDSTFVFGSLLDKEKGHQSSSQQSSIVPIFCSLSTYGYSQEDGGPY